MNGTIAWPFLRGIVHRADRFHCGRTAERKKLSPELLNSGLIGFVF
jgi:hypothetical protein